MGIARRGMSASQLGPRRVQVEISSASTRGGAVFTGAAFCNSLSLMALKRILRLAMKLHFHRSLSPKGPGGVTPQTGLFLHLIAFCLVE